MKRTFSIIASALILLAVGCKQEPKFKKAKGGLEYAILEGKGGQKVAYGNSIQFTAMGYHGDSILATPYDTIQQLGEIDSTRLPPELIPIFLEAKVGDSIITRILVDSAEKFGALPPYAKKGKYLGFRIKIKAVITDKALAEAERGKQMQQMMRVDSMARIQQITKDDKTLTDYIAKNNIKAVKTAKGTYVELQSPGEGELIDSGKTVVVDYKGMSLGGKIFDQSYNAAGVSEKPYTFAIGQRGAIEGWDDGLRLFRKGGKGRLLIPSGLAYGARGSMPNIQPNESLLFEITVKDILTPAQAKVEMEKQMKIQEQMQQMQQMQQQTAPPPAGK